MRPSGERKVSGRKRLLRLASLAGCLLAPVTHAQITPGIADLLFLDFNSCPQPASHGVTAAEGRYGRAIEFDDPGDFVEIDVSQRFDGLAAMTVGGWFFLRRSGEEYLLSRDAPLTGPLGERFFRRATNWVNFVLGLDQRGFLLGTINGNGEMPFPLVSISEALPGSWNQFAVSKDSNGVHFLYHNGVLVHDTKQAIQRGRPFPFDDQAPGEPLRLTMPYGGLIGEVWAMSTAVGPAEIARDFQIKAGKYTPAWPLKPVALREMNSHPATDLWPASPVPWDRLRPEIVRRITGLLGTPPRERVELSPRILSEELVEGYLRRKVSFEVEPGDRMPAYLLIPRATSSQKKSPAVICFYGTTSGAGKATTVGLSGRQPGSPPHPNLAFGVELVRAGFVVLAPDYLRDGERIHPGDKPYDTTRFYAGHPDWSIVGKDIWDTSRAIDYLETLDFVDQARIGMIGHSYGGHTTIFASALEPRIRVIVANGPVSDFVGHGLHWAVPKGASNSQSWPQLRPYLLEHKEPLTFYEFTSLIAPRPLLVGQAAGERRPREEENYAAVKAIYSALGKPERVLYHWYAGDHDFPPEARQAAVAWFKRWFPLL